MNEIKHFFTTTEVPLRIRLSLFNRLALNFAVYWGWENGAGEFSVRLFGFREDYFDIASINLWVVSFDLYLDYDE